MPSSASQGKRHNEGGCAFCSEIERQFVKVNIVGDVADLATVNGDLVCEHAGCWDLDGIGPVVVVVAKSISEVENGLLRNER